MTARASEADAAAVAWRFFDRSSEAGRLRECGLGSRLHLALALALAAASSPLFAGPGPYELQVPYTAIAPKIDGEIDALWAAAEIDEFGYDPRQLTFRALHDGRTLYLLVHYVTDQSFGLGSAALFTVDDEGGTPPQLGDGIVSLGSCPVEPNRGEGRFVWMLQSNPPPVVSRQWQPMDQSGFCSGLYGPNGEVLAMAYELGNGSRTEVALPIEGTSALEAEIGEEFGLFVASLYSEGDTIDYAGTWPEAPYTGAHAALAALACNLPAEDFDATFPLDWEVTGSGSTWRSSGTGGGECGVANQTGSSGDSACVTFDGSVESAASSLVSPWFSLAEATNVSLSYRGVYAEGATSPGHLVLEITADGTIWTPILDWIGSQGAAGGELVTIDLLAHITPGQPRVRLRWRFVGDNNVPAGAQIDDVRLVCGPFLFADGFEAGLTTHWSAEAP